MSRFVMTALLICLPALAVAAPKSVDDCEAIQSALAYNQCLASFGPRVGERTVRQVEPAQETVSEPRRRSRKTTSQRAGKGRRSMSFDAVSPRKRTR